MSLLISPKHGPAGSLIRAVHSVAYHRNGVGGQSFFRVEFDSEGERLIGLVTFEQPESLLVLQEAYVINPMQPEAAYYGTDSYGPALMQVCNESKWAHDVSEEAANEARERANRR